MGNNSHFPTSDLMSVFHNPNTVDVTSEAEKPLHKTHNDTGTWTFDTLHAMLT